MHFGSLGTYMTLRAKFKHFTVCKDNWCTYIFAPKNTWWQISYIWSPPFSETNHNKISHIFKDACTLYKLVFVFTKCNIYSLGLQRKGRFILARRIVASQPCIKRQQLWFDWKREGRYMCGAEDGKYALVWSMDVYI